MKEIIDVEKQKSSDSPYKDTVYEIKNNTSLCTTYIVPTAFASWSVAATLFFTKLCLANKKEQVKCDTVANVTTCSDLEVVAQNIASKLVDPIPDPAIVIPLIVIPITALIYLAGKALYTQFSAAEPSNDALGSYTQIKEPIASCSKA